MTTFAASLANSIAVARPMPALPPVISATFPSNWFILSPSLRSGATYSHPPRNVDVDFKHRTTDAAFRREHFCQRSAVNAWRGVLSTSAPLGGHPEAMLVDPE